MKKTDKIANILGRSAVIFSLILTSCHGSKEISWKPTSSRDEKIESMQKALNLCWDIFVDKNISYSEENRKQYKEYRDNSENVWIEFSKKEEEKFYRNPSEKTSDRWAYGIAGVFTFGIGFLSYFNQSYAQPPYDNYNYNDGIIRPNYSGVIRYCEQKIDSIEYKKSFLKREEELRKAEGEKELKQQELNAKKAAATASKFKEKIESENSYAKNLGYSNGILGYDRKIYNAGILGMIYTLNQNGAIAKAKDYLIKRGRENFRVQNIVGNYAIYGYTDDNFKTYRFALEINSGESYLQDSALRGRYFAVIGTQMFTTVMGQTVEILTFKKVE